MRVPHVRRAVVSWPAINVRFMDEREMYLEEEFTQWVRERRAYLVVGADQRVGGAGEW